MLGPPELDKLLRTSKATAQQVMQHSAGRLTLTVNPRKTVNLAAIRQLLQWAPPSCIKLHLSQHHNIHADWGMLSGLFSTSSQQGQHMQQFLGISDVCVKGFSLPSLVPADLVAMCPNLLTLHIRYCIVCASSSESSSSNMASSSSSSNTASSGEPHGSSGSVIATAQQLHTLCLEFVTNRASQLGTLPPDNARLTRSMQSAATHASQLRSAIPNVCCLKLIGSDNMLLQHVPLFGPQLQELHSSLASLPPRAVMHLQQLQKLVLQRTRISSTSIKQLLSLPSLTDLEVDSVDKELSKDYSSHPCKWQYLRLHLYFMPHQLHIDALAKLPLHSLTQPLRLGGDSDEYLNFCLPPLPTEDTLKRLQHLAQQLTRCGVQVPRNHVWWGTDDVDAMAQGAILAPSFIIIGPALGPPARVMVNLLMVDQPILEALVTVYGPSLKKLDFDQCDFEAGMQPAWRVALSGLPGLARLALNYCHNQDTVEFARTLAAAVAQQPAGRCIELEVNDATYENPEDLAALAKDGLEQLAGVDVVANDKVGHTDENAHTLSWHITSKHEP